MCRERAKFGEVNFDRPRWLAAGLHGLFSLLVDAALLWGCLDAFAMTRDGYLASA